MWTALLYILWLKSSSIYICFNSGWLDALKVITHFIVEPIKCASAQGYASNLNNYIISNLTFGLLTQTEDYKNWLRHFWCPNNTNTTTSSSSSTITTTNTSNNNNNSPLWFIWSRKIPPHKSEEFHLIMRNIRFNFSNSTVFPFNILSSNLNP